MSDADNSGLAAACQRFSRLAGVATTAVGGLVLLGWAIDVPALKSVLPGFATMKANTALSFVLAGSALWFFGNRQPSRAYRAAPFLGAAVALIGFLTLSQYLLGWDLRIDQLLLNDPGLTAGAFFPGRMSFITALNSVLLGLALLTLDAETRRGFPASQWLALTAGLVSIVALIGYSYGVEAFYRVASFSPVVPLLTALCFVVLSAGILCARPERGLAAILTSDTVGGMLARRLLPIVVIVPWLLGWLRLVGQHVGLYPTEFGTALLVTAHILIFGGVVCYYALWINRSDAARRQVEQELRDISVRRRAEQQLDRFFTLSLDLICIAGFDGYFKRLNPVWEKVLGFSREELLAMPYLDFVHVDDRAATQAEADKVNAGAVVVSFENRYRCKDGSYRWLLWKATPVLEEQLVYAAARDITERKGAEARLERLNAELEATNKELETFTYSVSHDLRAPLRHVSGFSRILLEDHAAQLNPDAQHCLSRVQQGVEQMGQLVDDLLNLSRISRQELRRQITGLTPLVEQTVQQLGGETQGRQVEWRLDPLPFADCDPGLMKQVFANLLSNAVKFTRTRARAVIEVGADTRNGEPVIHIRDNGVGFPMNYAD